MPFSETARAYGDALFDTDGDHARRIIEEGLRDGMTPEDVVFDVVLPSMERLMARGEAADERTSLAQHFLASQISADVVERMIPLFKKAPAPVGRVVIGSAPGDFHGLGKRIVVGCLKARMFEVVDLGLNVMDHRFVDEALKVGAQVIGVSSMMVHTATGPHGAPGVRALLRERGLSDRIRLIVGGAPYLFDEALFETVGADAWARNGLEAARLVSSLVQEVKP